jgi:GcrA cell cycle regulator
VRKLLTLWADGMGPSAIGREIGMTKNSVTSKGRRLGLKAHKPPHSPRRKPQAPIAGAAELAAAWRVSLRPARPALLRMPAPQPLPWSLLNTAPCRWPIGDPGTRAFRFCAAPVGIPSASYCAEHMQMAYVRPPRWREAGA